MRDNFSKDVKDILAARVGHRCSNPDCGAVTSGPAERSDKAVNVGVAAHITAAAAGGPRYDPALSSTQRSGADNGIWLCQTDSKLVDADSVRYSVSLLRRWKAEAEARTDRMLTAGLGSLDSELDLTIPSLNASDSLLSFANTRLACVGRISELSELTTFLAAEALFSWWLWTGPAGVGKSRLAVELCRFASNDWHAGFLREAHQSRLGDLRTVRPTLVVVDYASQRSAWLSDALAQLSRRQRGAKVRVLILERQATGSWWDTARRHDRMEESAKVAATMYALPRQLAGLSRDDARPLIRSTAAQLGHGELTATHVEDIADQAERIDPAGRPLFVQVATMDWLDANGGSGGRDDALRRLITRMAAQTRSLAGSSASARLATNVLVLATALGGVSVDDYADLLQTPQIPAGLLPNVFQSLGSATVDDLIDGVRPDIVGELFVLDRLEAQGTDRLAASTLLQRAWLTDPNAYRGFAERTAADHPEHAQLSALLSASVSGELPLASAELAVAIIPMLRRSDHPVVGWAFSRLASVRDQADHEEVDKLLTTARFRFANLVFKEGDMQRAFELFTDALASCDAAWPQYSGILNNRGITLSELGQPGAAFADYSAVIEAPVASNEARACALNNRADLRFDDGDIAGSIADRSTILELQDTTYNRRFIALVRRAIAWWSLGEKTSAYRDIQAILDTDDIAVEQKMAARLQRAEWLIEEEEPTEARPDIDAVIASYRNFDSVDKRARELHTPEADNA